MDNNVDLEFMKRLLVLLADCQALIAEYKPDCWEGFDESDLRKEGYEAIQKEIELVLSILGKR